MATVAVIQARDTSVRLPGKSSMPLAGKPVIDHVIDRAIATEGVDKVCVAVPDIPGQDGLIEAVAKRPDVSLVAGPDKDLIRRFRLAIEATNAKTVVRLWGDAPAVDVGFAAALINAYHASDAAWAAPNAESALYEGSECHVMPATAMLVIDEEAADTAEREAFNVFLERQPNRFPRIELGYKPALTHLKVLIDTPADYDRMVKIFDRLYEANPIFGAVELAALSEREPDLFVSDNPDLIQTRFPRPSRQLVS